MFAEVRSTEVIEVDPYPYPGSWLIGASTYAIDRFTPDVERIWRPPAEHCGGTITMRMGPGLSIPRPRSSRKRKLLNKFRPPKPIDLGSRAFFDARDDDFFNWSHQVNYFLSLAIAARARFSRDLVVVLPAGMPPIAHEVFRLFRFDVASTDGPVSGIHCAWSVTNRQVVATGRPQLIAPLSQDIFSTFDLPKKVFLSRRGSRSIQNEAEIELTLAERGFTKIYPEQLSCAQQFALIRQATDLVAIHGAGIAPLQYRSPDAEPVKLVELSPVGHMTRWFGIMCDQVGGKYIAVRGQIRPEYVKDLYGDQAFFRSNDPFVVDPRSLNVALQMVA